MDWVISNMDAILQIAAIVIGLLLGLPKAKELRNRAAMFIKANHLQSAELLARGIVADIYQTTVRDLKTKGTFNDEAKQTIANNAMAILKKRLKAEGVEVAEEIVPHLIEAAVSKLKAKKKE